MNLSEKENRNRKEEDQRVVAICEEIVFRNDTNGYTVAEFKTRGNRNGRFTGVGAMPFISAGETVDLFGKWTDHPVYGRQLRVERFTLHHEVSESELTRYLSSGSIPWIGPKTARKIVERFGKETLNVLRDHPDRLQTIRGISARKAAEISGVFRQKGEFQELSLLLSSYGFGAARIMSVYKRFGPNATSVLRNNPYLLVSEIHGIGFLTADRLARSMGYDAASPFRVGSAILYLVSISENEGNTFVRADQLLKEAVRLLEAGESRRFPDEKEHVFEREVRFDHTDMISSFFDRNDTGNIQPEKKKDDTFFISEKTVIDGLNYLLQTAKIIAYRTDKDGIVEFERTDSMDDRLKVALPRTFEAEISAGGALVRKQMIEETKSSEPSVGNEKDCGDKIREISRSLSIDLSDEQYKALVSAVQSPRSVITGGPGTGKTTIVAVLVCYFGEKNEKVVLCAPTGRAAKRLSEACGYAAGTIHRLLEVGRPDSSGSGEAFFGRNEDNPIEADVVIVDETSMLDTILLDALLKALPKGCRIVFIGDKDQLPSVSAGNVLSDIISSGIIPCTRLVTIYRQAQRSRIVLSAHSVLNGKEMIFDPSFESDCMFISKRNTEEIAEAVKRLYAEVLPDIYGINPLREAMVLCPSRKGAAGITNLNLILQEAYGVLSDRHIKSRGFRFCVGDRVMQIRNDYELAYVNADGTRGQGVFNGELGVIRELDPRAIELVVETDDKRMVTYDSERLEDLEPAYAITVHKSQGSEFPVVILAIPGGPPMLYNRNLLYTAITRARQRLFVVSDRQTLQMMIRNRSQAQRDTSLKDFLIYFSRKDVQN